MNTLRNFTRMKLCCWFVREQNPAPHFLLSNRKSVIVSSHGKENVAEFVHLELFNVLTRPPSHLRRINRAHVSGFDLCNVTVLLPLTQSRLREEEGNDEK